MNLVFDIGNVLLNYLPVEYLRGMFPDERLVQELNQLVFCSPEWARLDEGTISPGEATEAFVARRPRLEREIRLAMGNRASMLTPIPGSIALLPRVKQAGHGLYFLSNYHEDLKAYILEKYAFFELFDGGIFSCDVKLVKPGEAIYRKLLQDYQLVPEQTVFFDDMQGNVDGANRVGIRGVLFTGPADVEAWI